MNPENIKTSYCPEVIRILEEVKIQENIEACQKLRERFPNLKKVSDIDLIIYALKMYQRHRERILRNKKKRGFYDE